MTQKIFLTSGKISHDPTPWHSSRDRTDSGWRSPVQHLNDAPWYDPRPEFEHDNEILVMARFFLKTGWNIPAMLEYFLTDHLIHDAHEYKPDHLAHARRVLNALQFQWEANNPPCPHTYSRVKFDGGSRAVVCNACSIIVTHLREE